MCPLTRTPWWGLALLHPGSVNACLTHGGDDSSTKLWNPGLPRIPLWVVALTHLHAAIPVSRRPTAFLGVPAGPISLLREGDPPAGGSGPFANRGRKASGPRRSPTLEYRGYSIPQCR